ncbi:MAG: carbon-nitrogen hydrolase family protein [Candidatus Methanoplasma sp.]|jgi:predicted amidohydrolase|nr:carbon-nitrogen hydrolase family protein [Candidatus Methanoplasma sp.]
MGLRIAVCQAAAVRGDVGANLCRASSIVSQTRADMYVFPEMFLAGYGADCSGLRDDVEAALNRLRSICLETGSAILIGGPCHLPGGIRNSLYFLSPSAEERYDKMHLANFGVYSEGGFAAGGEPVAVDFGGMRFGLSICYDLFFPELYRRYASLGADANVCISASASPSRKYLERALPARSLENVAYTVFVNNAPNGGDVDFYGGSRLVGPLGDTLAEAGGGDEVVCVYVDGEVVSRARSERRHLSDMRRDVFSL